MHHISASQPPKLGICDGPAVQSHARPYQDGQSNLVPVDARQLTDRQREVLTTAHGVGYFEYPQGVDAGEVTSELDTGPSTFIEHLNAAQSKLLDEFLSRV